jgi:hypothetical protein
MQTHGVVVFDVGATKPRASLSETGELGRIHSPFKDLVSRSSLPLLWG